MLVMCRFLQTRKRTTLLEIWVWLFLIYTLLLYLIQFQSPFYYLWGMRNSFRFYAAFFAFGAFLKPTDADHYLDLFDKLFWVDVLVSIWQFFVMGMDGDHLGGLFGTEAGGNGYTNIFFLIMVTKSMVFYLEKRESAASCFSKCAAALIVAAMAELKFFYVEFAIVVLLAVLFTSFTWRKLWIILGSAAGLLVCAALLTKLFPGFAGWFSIQWFLENAISDKGYTSSGDLNRLNAITQINELWLQSGWQRLFGLGLGNCDTSTFSFLNTPFFEANGDLHYTWLSYAMIYLETGYIGLIFYWGFFVLLFFHLLKLEKRGDAKVRSYFIIARILAVLCVLISVYNSSLRTEAAYMVYFVMAVPFAFSNNR